MSKQVKTHKLSEAINPVPPSALSLRTRLPGWHPDAVDFEDPDQPGSKIRVNLFLEEAIGMEAVAGNPGQPRVLSFNAQFAEGADNSKWILGDALPAVDDPANSAFTRLLHDLARLARRYNAALYSLRRLKFNFDLFGGAHSFPPANVHSRDQDLSRLTKDELRPLIAAAEADWREKADAINDFVDAKSPEFKDPEKYQGFVFQAADMVEVNNYVVSMRVVVLFRPGPAQLIGSSSHVSISSAFSSSNP